MVIFFCVVLPRATVIWSSDWPRASKMAYSCGWCIVLTDPQMSWVFSIWLLYVAWASHGLVAVVKEGAFPA